MSEEFFVTKKDKNTVVRIYATNDFNNGAIVGTFDEKGLQKPIQKEFRPERVIKREGDKIHVKWIGYGNSFRVGLIKNT